MYRYKKGDLVQIVKEDVGRVEGCDDIFTEGSLAVVVSANPYAVEISSENKQIYVNVKHVEIFLPENITEEDMENTYYKVAGLSDEILTEFCLLASSVIGVHNGYVANQIDEAVQKNSGKVLYVTVGETHISLKTIGQQHDLSDYKYQDIAPFLRYCGFDDEDWETSHDENDPLSLCSCLSHRSLLSVTLGFHDATCPLFKGN